MARVALVTGGTRGIGHAISIALKNNGYRVAANYAGNDAAAQQFQVETGIPVFKWNVGDYDACEAGCAQITKEVGPVDVLVNNAGITRDAMLHRMTKEQWDEVISVDLDCVFNMSRQVIDGMRARNFGRIINISSINGRKGQMGQTNYSAAKAGMHGFTKALAFEGAAKGITVNTIAPGYIATEMVARRAEGSARDQDPSADPRRPPRRVRGDRARRGVPRRRRRRLHHRRLLRHQRRPLHGDLRRSTPQRCKMKMAGRQARPFSFVALRPRRAIPAGACG